MSGLVPPAKSFASQFFSPRNLLLTLKVLLRCKNLLLESSFIKEGEAVLLVLEQKY